MRNRMFLRYIILFLTICMLLCTNVSADVPYYSYSQTEWQTSVSSPEAYKPDKITANKMYQDGMLDKPTDFCIDGDGSIYVLDSNRIVVYDSNLNYIKEIQDFTLNGESQNLNNPSGIFVAEDGFLYIADTGNSRGLKVDCNGNILQQYCKPDSNSYTESVYVPLKIMCDQYDNVYILSQNVYQGMIVFTNDGTFKSFFGSPRVQLTISQLSDKMWRSIMTKSQKENMSKYVPTEFTNIDIDPKGFIYTCSSYTTTDVEQIRKLNYIGENVYPYTENFGETDTVYYKRQEILTNFIDVAISEEDIIYALDSTRARIYAYDQDGNMLYTFGTNGGVVGAFLNPVAVGCYQDDVYVLDNTKATITRFHPTEYGALIQKAVNLYLDGQYKEAMEPWEKILSMNSNYQLAYNGLGDAYMKLGNYKNAVQYYRRGYNREKESNAFLKYRSEVLREHTDLVLGALLIAFVLLAMVTNRKLMLRLKLKASSEDKLRLKGFKLMKGVLRRPVETYDEMKHMQYCSWPMIVGIMAIFLLVQILKRQCYGFRFNNNDPNTLNILIEISSTVIPFFLFCISNWLVCSIAEGKGKFGEIATNVSYALVPYMIIQALGIVLSNVIALEEAQFFSWFLLIGTVWSVILVFQAIRIVHQFSSGKTILMIFFTVCGMVIILFILLLLFTLFRQISSFAYSVYSELMYRR